MSAPFTVFVCSTFDDLSGSAKQGSTPFAASG